MRSHPQNTLSSPMATAIPRRPISPDRTSLKKPSGPGPGESPRPHRPSSPGCNPQAPLVLVADEEPAARTKLRRLLECAGYRTAEANGGREAVARTSAGVAAVLLGPSMPDACGLEVLGHIRKHFVDVQVVMISKTGGIRDAVAAMKHGAFEYLTRPLDRDELLIRIGQAARATQLARDNRRLRQAVSSAMTSAKLEGSPAAIEGPDNMGLAGMTLAEIERHAIIETLRANGGNRSKTARSLKVSEKTIYNKIKRYNLRATSD